MNVTAYQLAMLAATINGRLASVDPEAAIELAIDLIVKSEAALQRKAELRQLENFGPVKNR